MGRRRLLPNINTLLLQLHLPYRTNKSSSSKANRNKEKEVVVVELESNHTPQQQPPLSSILPPVALVVSFGNCEIRTYAQVLGDHPCCSEGCPIQLGWSYSSEDSITIDDYEHDRQAAALRLLTLINSNSEYSHETHTLRLTPEERRSILIGSKQQNAATQHQSTNTTNTSTTNNNNTLEGGGGDDDCRDERCDPNAPNGSSPAVATRTTTTENSSASNSSGVGGASVSSSSSTTTNTKHHSPNSDQEQQHERELIRECRKLHRGGGWNVNVKATRKRNRRNQEAFFGSPTRATTTTMVLASSPTNPVVGVEVVEPPAATARTQGAMLPHDSRDHGDAESEQACTIATNHGCIL